MVPIQPPSTPLTDGSIVVRPRGRADLEAIAAASHDPETLRWLEDPPMDAAAVDTGTLRADEAWRSGRAAPMTIADAVTDEAVGIINLQLRDDDTATLAYSVFPTCRGRGIAPRAVVLVAGWALGELGLPEVRLEADAANTASIRVAEKAGFHPLRAERATTTKVFVRRPD